MLTTIRGCFRAWPSNSTASPRSTPTTTVATWISDYGRVLSTRNFTLTDMAAGREFGRAVTQWAMIDLQSRSAIDLSWVGDAHADAIVDAAPPTDKPRKIRAVKPYRDGRTPRGVQRHRLQPPRQHDALYRNDARHAARRHADAGGSGAAGHSFPERVPFRADADGGVRVARSVRRCSKFRPTALRLPCVPLSNGNRPAAERCRSRRLVERVLQFTAAKPFFIMESATKTQSDKTSIR